jgi:hypothetical protein
MRGRQRAMLSGRDAGRDFLDAHCMGPFGFDK